MKVRSAWRMLNQPKKLRVRSNRQRLEERRASPMPRYNIGFVTIVSSVSLTTINNYLWYKLQEGG